MALPAVHQLLHTLSYGDAISGEALTLQELFRAQGRESNIYAINIHPRFKQADFAGRAIDYRELRPDTEGEVVLHYSLGSPLNSVYRSLSRATKTLIYHNLTPARWFEAVNPRIASDIRSGLAELPELCRATDRLIADSQFNAGELRALGFEAQVLELPVDGKRWREPPNPGIAELLRSSPGIHVLHVGRLAPNKCIEDIIKAFYFLHYHHTRESTLWLVGIDIDTELYSFSLKRLARELEVDQAVRFVGPMADSEVRALYEGCSVYLCMSEHEGFCLPLVEAMHFGLPVIAYRSSAVPDTLGGAGILVSEKRHPEIGELCAEVAQNLGLRQSLISRGKARATELSVERFARRVSEVFAQPPSGSSRSESAARTSYEGNAGL